MVDVPLSGGPPVTVADPFVASLVEGTDTKSGGKLGEPVLYFALGICAPGGGYISISSWRGPGSLPASRGERNGRRDRLDLTATV